MTYARARLWLGISGVGLMVTVASVALWYDLPHGLLKGVPTGPALIYGLVCYILLSIPSDLLGGYVLPRRFGRSRLTFGGFAFSWIRGVVAQAVVMGLSGWAIISFTRFAGKWAGIVEFAALLLVLLLIQEPLARLVSGISPVPTDLVFYRAKDPGFVGGWAGLAGRRRLLLPESWKTILSAEALRVQRIRREGVLRTGARKRGVALALMWNVGGFAVAASLPNSSLADASGFLTVALYFTLWSFMGLLLLPSLNRPAVFEADRYALEHGVSEPSLLAAIAALDRLQDDEPARSTWVERIFHPIPSVASRAAALRSGKVYRGAWQGARMTLYLSWAGCSLLSRAVHCNAGRPELWVFFPGD